MALWRANNFSLNVLGFEKSTKRETDSDCFGGGYRKSSRLDLAARGSKVVSEGGRLGKRASCEWWYLPKFSAYWAEED